MTTRTDTPNTFNPGMEVEIGEAFAGKNATAGAKKTSGRQALSFDDIGAWSVIYYAGREMMVTAKGDMVHPEEGRHVALDAMDKKQPQRVIVHESWMNYWLNIRKIISPSIAGIRRDD